MILDKCLVLFELKYEYIGVEEVFHSVSIGRPKVLAFSISNIISSADSGKSLINIIIETVKFFSLYCYICLLSRHLQTFIPSA